MQPEDLLPSIAAINTTVFRLPMYGTLRWGQSSSLSELRHVLVEVLLADGSSGVAEAPPRPTIYGETAQSIVGVIEQELKPRTVGERPTVAMQRLQEIKYNYTAKGAIDMALHAAVAQHNGVSLSTQIGASQARVPVSYILGIGDLDTVLAEADRVYAQGVRVLKVKVGRDWQADIVRIKTLQAALPDDMRFYADANECFRAEDATERLIQLREMGLLYCEEPLPVELVRERGALQSAHAMPIIGDDSCFTLRDLRRELALDTFDILNIKTPRTGYSESSAMLQLAAGAGKGVMIGSNAGSSIGAARAAICAAKPGIDHPSELSFFLKLKEDLLAEPLPIVDGYIRLADADNARIDPDRLREAAVQQLR